MTKKQSTLDIISACVEKALKSGADAADAIMFDTRDITVRERMGKPETIERAESTGLGLRVLVGKKGGFRQSIISSNDVSKGALDELIEKAVTMAKNCPVDPYAGLADERLLAKDFAKLDLADKKEPSEETLKKWAAETEEAAMSVKNVTNSEGADASFSHNIIALVTSTGFSHSYESTSFSISASVIAGVGTKMETDYDYAVSRHATDLRKPSDVGKKAGELAAKKLNPRKIKSCQVPLIFEPRVARGLLSSLAGAVNGASIARGTSFLKDMMEKQIFPEEINIVDDPLIIRGLASEPFDDEGVKGEKRFIIENGVLKTWFLDVRSANKLGLETTGHAARGISSPPHPSSSNLYMEAGKATPQELIEDIKQGILITDTFGMGVNGVTGDYSQGASGFFIDKGEIAYPISEITIAGNLKDMFKNLTAANDLELKYSTNSPTLLIEGMTTAGI